MGIKATFCKELTSPQENSQEHFMRDACQARDISLSESLTIRLMPTVPLSPHLLIIVLPQHKMLTCQTPGEASSWLIHEEKKNPTWGWTLNDTNCYFYFKYLSICTAPFKNGLTNSWKWWIFKQREIPNLKLKSFPKSSTDQISLGNFKKSIGAAVTLQGEKKYIKNVISEWKKYLLLILRFLKIFTC